MDLKKADQRLKLSPSLCRYRAENELRWLVNIDLSQTYRKVAKTVFPNATIVADRIHVIRLINHHMLANCLQLDPSAKYNVAYYL